MLFAEMLLGWLAVCLAGGLLYSIGLVMYYYKGAVMLTCTVAITIMLAVLLATK